MPPTRELGSGTNGGVRQVAGSSNAVTPANEEPTGGMDTERTICHYRDAGTWPAEPTLTAMLDNQFNAFAAVRLALPSIAIAVTGAAERLRERGPLIYCGAGASGRLAIQDGVELHPTFGWPVDRLVYLTAGGRPALISSVEGAEDEAMRAPARLPRSTLARTASLLRPRPAAQHATRARSRRQLAPQGADHRPGQQLRRPFAGHGGPPRAAGQWTRVSGWFDTV
jgi:hypothetical protein